MPTLNPDTSANPHFYAVTQTVSVGLVPGIPRLCVVGIAEGDGAARLDALARLHHWHPELSSAVADAWASTLSLIRDDMTGAAVDRSERWLPPLPDRNERHRLAELRERVANESVDAPHSDISDGAPAAGTTQYFAMNPRHQHVVVGIGYSVDGAREDAARRRRLLDSDALMTGARTSLMAPLSDELLAWAESLAVAQLVAEGAP